MLFSLFNIFNTTLYFKYCIAYFNDQLLDVVLFIYVKLKFLHINNLVYYIYNETIRFFACVVKLEV